MNHEPEPEPVVQLSLLAEPACALTVRLLLQRGDPIGVMSYTITRPDDSWLACLVKPRTGGPEAFRATMASLMHEGLKQTFEIMGPF